MKRFLVLLIPACMTTVEPAKPWVSGGGVAVTLDEPFGVSTSWEGECNPGMLAVMGGGGGGTGRKTVPCNYVDYEIQVGCNGACTSQVDKAMGSIMITPTKLGRLDVKVTLEPKSALKKKKTFDLQPVWVATPTKAAAICELSNAGGALIDVSLSDGKQDLEHSSAVRVVDGAACERGYYSPTARRYTCKLDSVNTLLEVSGKGYKMQASTACTIVYPAPSQATRVAPDKHEFSIYDPYNGQCLPLLDNTKTAFAEWGWKVGAIDDQQLKKTEHGVPYGKATLAAERLGVAALVTIAYVADGENPGCTWVLDTKGTVKGSDQVPRGN